MFTWPNGQLSRGGGPAAHSRLSAIGLLATFALFGLSPAAFAKARSFRYYPQDLDMELPGRAEADLRLGWSGGAAQPHLVAPDIQLDLGLSRTLEIGLDVQAGTLARGDGWTFTDFAWISAKHLLLDRRARARAVAVGIQHGPRLGQGLLPDALGYQGVVLASLRWPDAMFVLALGAYRDPRANPAVPRALGWFGSVDATASISSDWGIEGQLSGANWGSYGWSAAACLGGARGLGTQTVRLGLSASIDGAGPSAGFYFGAGFRTSLH